MSRLEVCRTVCNGLFGFGHNSDKPLSLTLRRWKSNKSFRKISSPDPNQGETGFDDEEYIITGTIKNITGKCILVKDNQDYVGTVVGEGYPDPITLTGESFEHKGFKASSAAVVYYDEISGGTRYWVFAWYNGYKRKVVYTNISSNWDNDWANVKAILDQSNSSSSSSYKDGFVLHADIKDDGTLIVDMIRT